MVIQEMSLESASKATGPGKNLLVRLVIVVVLLGMVSSARASVALLMEEPYGDFGAFNPTGHAAVYLNHVCAETATQLRMCRNGEYGVVISRYHKINGYDWIAMPLIPYLYAVTSADNVPLTVDKAKVAELRDVYRREYLTALAPDTATGEMPKGEWTQLVGASYDRTIHGFEVESTTEQDERFIAYVNDKKNVGHFNLFFHNCADFSRVVLDIYFPHAIHRSFVADAGLMTPKQVARSLVRYGKDHPEAKMSAFVIPQVPGSVSRSHGVDGVAESLVKSKKYIIPLVVLNPEVTGGIVVAYLMDGRLKMPKDARVFAVNDAEVTDAPVGVGTVPGGERSVLSPTSVSPTN
ncbi:MAG TPA: hypothetical protein VNY78_00905 [Edaphobacter sp.]|nr:hypothetical protein [Edaphobacter sp.]